MILPLPLTNGNANNALIQADSRGLTNMYAEPSLNGGFILRKRAGLELALTLSGTGAVRGLYTTSTDRLFSVVGSTLYEISTSNVATSRGTLSSNIGYVNMADNGVYLVLADGVALLRYNLDTNVLSNITDTDAPINSPVTGVIDGFFFGFKPNAVELGEYQWSELDDPTDWPATSYSYAEKVPDKMVALVPNGGQLWLFGNKSFEIHGNTGNLLNTWALISGSEQEIGCASRNSVARSGGSVFWLGSDKEGHAQVYRSVGYQPQKISTFYEDSLISDIYDISDAIGMTYQLDGHVFYKLTFQSGDLTLVYNITTGYWHKETWYNDITMREERSRASCHAFFNGQNYIGDSRNGKIYIMKNDVYSDNGNPIICEVIAPKFGDGTRPLSFGSLMLDAEMATGTNTSDPQIKLSWSDDDGYNWSMWRTFGLGKAGQFNKRLKVNRLGMSRRGERVFKINHSDNSKFTLMNRAFVEVE